MGFPPQSPPSLQVLVRVLSWQQQPGNALRRVLLMPSVRDATATPAFPQPPLALDASVTGLAGGDAAARLRSLQSPCSFVVAGAGAGGGGGVTVSACSQDGLLHLCSL